MTNPTTPGEFEEAVNSLPCSCGLRPGDSSHYPDCPKASAPALLAAHKREVVAELEEVIKMIDHLQTPSNVKPTVQGRIQQLQQEEGNG